MAKAKLQQVKLTSCENATQPPFPGGWVLAIFDALNSFAPALAAKHKLPISQRTQERIKADVAVKQRSYDEIEDKLVELITALFPTVSAVNGFAKKYANEYFRVWKQAAEIARIWAKSLGFKPSESHVLGRALVRDLVLRLCYLESCERRLSKANFSEAELAFLQHDSPVQVYQALVSAQKRSRKISQEKLAEEVKVDDRILRRIKQGESIPSFNLLFELKPLKTTHRLLAGIGFVDQLLNTLGLGKSVLRNEFPAIASVFFRNHPTALKTFIGKIPRTMQSGGAEFEACDFERFAAFGDGLLLHPGFKELYCEMPDSIWRCHLYTLQFARIVELAQAYYQFSKEGSDSPLEDVLREAKRESDCCPYRWMDRLRQRNETPRVE